ncbi:MAG: hypothetical protein HKO05_10975 [Erythrobacter sp.]|jgi:hypothetical protein|nr:hypothetical protein [Erythrobacter sp.]RZV29067.1 MAG: hypothetical protein EX262_10025 [Sphingomonadaceae bacterium]
MAQAVIDCGKLPDRATEASAEFYTEWLPRIELALRDTDDDLVLLLPHAAYDHDDWRRAVARDLARAFAPCRVNVIGGGDAPSQEATIAYLENAPGVTGQYLPLDSAGAGNPVRQHDDQ